MIICGYCGENYDATDEDNPHVVRNIGEVFEQCPEADQDNDNDPECAADWGLDY